MLNPQNQPTGRNGGAIAHDFNNLLTAVNGYTDIVLSRLDPSDPNRPLLEEVRKAGDRATILTHELLLLSNANEVNRKKGENTLPALAGDPFPMASQQGRDVLDSSAMPSAKPKRRQVRTVLVVEDDEHIRSLVRAVLEAKGYTVLEAAGAREAFYLYKRHKGRIHLLLTDVIMPGKSGREVARELQAVQPGLRTIFMSGYTDDMLVREAMDSGNALFLAKPFTGAQLLGKIEEAETATFPEARESLGAGRQTAGSAIP